MSDARRVEDLPIWPSLARILATIAIFVFHYLGLLERYQYRLSVWALLTFSFLSGYLAHARNTPRRPWIVKRYFSVMIPHWIVITPVLVANAATGYKPISTGEAIITFLGGNLFLSNPIYVITWYVTFVLLLYGYLLIDSYADGWQRLAVTAIGLVAFGRLALNEYFVPFSIGLYLAALLPPRLAVGRTKVTASVARLLFRVQELCYPFFLAHGAVLLAMLKVFRFSPVPLFVVSLLMSVVAAWVVESLSRPLMKFAIQTLGSTPSPA